MTTKLTSRPTVDVASGELERPAWTPVIAIAAATSAVLLALSGRYGVHRDEFYYLASGRHLAWGFVDHPPLTPLLARWQADVFGTSTMAFRVFPSLAAGFAVIMCGVIARELGGGRRAQLLAALGGALLPAVRGPHFLFGTTSTDQVFWAVLVFLAVRLLRTRDTRWWMAIGAVAGVGMLNKHTVAFALVMIVGGLVCTPQRRLLVSRDAALGAFIALLLFAPNLIWQLTNGLPAREMTAAIAEDNGGSLGGLPDFVLESIALWAIAGVVIAWWGWHWLLRTEAGRPWRALGWGALMVVPLVALSGGKSYYVAPLALLLVPAASVAVAPLRPRRRAFVTIVAVGGAIGALATLPLLPPDRVDSITPLNREFGEMIGWDDLAHQVSDVYRALPAHEQPNAVIFTSDYGEAGSLELDGEQLGLPPVYSGHNSYADWGRPADGTLPVIVVGIGQENLRWCTDIEPAGVITNAEGIDNEEAGDPIVVCRGLTAPWSQLWPELEHIG